MTLDVRVDPLTGTPTLVVSSRQDRPDSQDEDCPFCPGGLEAPGWYEVHRFTNRWPALPDERSEIVLHSPLHNATMWSLGVEGAGRVVRLWAERTAELGRRPDVAYVLVFENRGPEVGATITHPHSQIYAFDRVPEAPQRELEQDPCALCSEDPGDRLVSESDDWRAWVPYAASWPYELRLAPVSHQPDLPALARVGHDGAAAVLVDVLERLDRLFAQPMPYMLWVHQRPTDGGAWPAAHVHVHLVPTLRKQATMRHVAAGELGSGVYFNPVEPEAAAARLRQVR